MDRENTKARAPLPAPGHCSELEGRPRILLIEDDPALGEVMQELLELAGWTTVVALNGPSGVAKARSLHPEVVLCDLGLPGMDGYAVARAIRADEVLGGIRLVALSGSCWPEDAARALAAGFDHHLSKPPRMERLRQVVEA